MHPPLVSPTLKPLVARRAAAMLAVVVSVGSIALACGSASTGSTTGMCCDIGTQTVGFPSCICGKQATADGGTCSITDLVGLTCTVSCSGMSAAGTTVSSCPGQ